jgi:CubicO group peptidase (beta-lactamase class C family)
VEHLKDEIHFALPGEAGKFRGRLHLGANGKRIFGHWIQLGGVAFYSYSYASPVELTELAPGVWRGDVVPLDERASFYISIERTPDGSLKAFFRNPEANRFRGQTFDVALQDGTVTLLDKGQATLRGTYDSQSDVLSLPVLGSYPLVQFARQDRSTALGFYPRIPSPSGPYVYQTPVAENDGWATASLADVGLELSPIAELIQTILRTPPSLSNPVNIQSLLIARHGKLVFEEYFYGFNKERPHDMRSAGKTFGPVLVGLAREQGANISLDSPAYSFFPEYKHFANWDERKNHITVRDLMTMTSGLACDDHDPSSAGGEDSMQMQTIQSDWYKFAMDLPMARDPGGERAVYCASDINLLGGIVKNTTGSWLPEFFQQYFARPLQITSYHLNLMPSGEFYLGGGLYLRARDQLKLGQLYLSGGVWNGNRILSEVWVKDSVQRHSGFPPAIPTAHRPWIHLRLAHASPASRRTGVSRLLRGRQWRAVRAGSPRPRYGGGNYRRRLLGAGQVLSLGIATRAALHHPGCAGAGKSVTLCRLVVLRNVRCQLPHEKFFNQVGGGCRTNPDCRIFEG